MTTNGDHQDNLSKDEVGWYFVEQYYNTLSKSVDKLHLFYGTKSQFVSGLETEVANVAVGRQDIQSRIAQMGFQDAKVRVSNVDSQASLDSIVIQVIGEISNKSEEPRKFVQTFVLAKQHAGYFVLNDILRYIKEEDEETAAETAAETDAVTEAAPAEDPIEAAEPPTQPTEVAAAKPQQLDAAVVDKKLEEVSAAVEATPAVAAVATPDVTFVKPTESTAAPAVVAAQAPDPEKAVEEVAKEEIKKAEAPKEPTSTATASTATAPTPAAAPTEPEKPKGPPKPMTWASRAAAAAGSAHPAVAIPKLAAATIAAAATRPAAPASASSPVSSQAASAAKPVSAENTIPGAPAAAAAPAKESDSEWQTAGVDSKRQNRPVSISGHVQDKETTLAYVKYVTEKVDNEALRSHLEKFGPVVYFDISRPKNCAFVEFAAPAGYLAAVAANPHVINGESILVEARRPKASAYGGANYSRNGVSARGGRGGYEARNGSQGGGRGGFTNGQRGRGGAPRGRGGAQAAAVV